MTGTNETSTPPPRLTSEEAERIWQAKWAYDWHNTGLALIALFMLFELGLAAVQGAFQQRLLVVCGQIGVLLGLRWAVRVSTRWAGRAWRQFLRWYAHRQRQQRVQRGTLHHPGAVLILALVCGLTLTGCKDMVRGVAHLYGYEGDPYAHACAPESLEAGHCIPVKQGAQP